MKVRHLFEALKVKKGSRSNVVIFTFDHVADLDQAFEQIEREDGKMVVIDDELGKFGVQFFQKHLKGFSHLRNFDPHDVVVEPYEKMNLFKLHSDTLALKNPNELILAHWIEHRLNKDQKQIAKQLGIEYEVSARINSWGLRIVVVPEFKISKSALNQAMDIVQSFVLHYVEEFRTLYGYAGEVEPRTSIESTSFSTMGKIEYQLNFPSSKVSQDDIDDFFHSLPLNGIEVFTKGNVNIEDVAKGDVKCYAFVHAENEDD